MTATPHAIVLPATLDAGIAPTTGGKPVSVGKSTVTLTVYMKVPAFVAQLALAFVRDPMPILPM
jgi:hypothetical protein